VRLGREELIQIMLGNKVPDSQTDSPQPLLPVEIDSSTCTFPHRGWALLKQLKAANFVLRFAKIQWFLGFFRRVKKFDNAKLSQKFTTGKMVDAEEVLGLGLRFSNFLIILMIFFLKILGRRSQFATWGLWSNLNFFLF
jgi:hypothetical protein